MTDPTPDNNTSSTAGEVQQSPQKRSSQQPTSAAPVVLLSLRTLCALLLLIVGVVTAVVAFVPLQQAATSSAMNTASQFTDAVAKQMQQAVLPFYANANLFLAQLQDYIDQGQMDTNNNASTLQIMTAVTAKAGFTAMYALDDGLGFMTALTNSFAPTVIPPAGMALNCIWNVTTEQFDYWTYNLTTYQPSPAYRVPPTGFRPGNFDQTKRPFWWIVRYRSRWGNIYLDAGKMWANMIRAQPIKDPVSNRTGIISIITTTKDVARYLSTVQVAKTGRLMLFDVPNRTFVGGNFPAPLVVNINGSATLLPLSYVNDSLVVAGIAALGEALFHCTAPCSVDFGSGNSLVYARVMSVSDQYGLNFRLLVLIPSNDFLGEIRDSTNTTIGAVIGAVAGLLIAAFLLMLYLLQPLVVLEQKLYNSASFASSDEEDRTTSIVKEFYNIEVAYAKLVKELQKVKSFLPQSVLRQLEQDDDEEDGDEGDVDHSHVYTDATSSQFSKGRLPSTAPSASSRLNGASASEIASRCSRNSSSKRHERRIAADLSLEQRRVTVVFVNVRRFHALADSVTPAQLCSVEAALVNAIMQAVNGAKGVVDSFQGDRFMFSFNASTNCAQHGAKAAQAILSIGAAVEEAAAKNAWGKQFGGLCLGAATGMALCGNTGTAALQRFTIVGRVVPWAQALMREAHALGVGNLVAASTYELMQYEHVLQHRDCVTLPQSKQQPQLVSQLKKRKETKMDEWMYEIHEDANKKPELSIALLNQAWDQFSQGRASRALQMITEAAEPPHKDATGAVVVRDYSQEDVTHAKSIFEIPFDVYCGKRQLA